MWQPQWQLLALTCQTTIQAVVGSGCDILSLVWYVCSYYVAPRESFKVKESYGDLCEATTPRQTFNLKPSFVCLHSTDCTNGKTGDPLFNRNYILLVRKWERLIVVVEKRPIPQPQPQPLKYTNVTLYWSGLQFVVTLYYSFIWSLMIQIKTLSTCRMSHQTTWINVLGMKWYSH